MAKNPAHTSVHQVVPKLGDLECHLRVVDIDGIRALELRDFISSTQTYGRGYWIPLDHTTVFSLINGITDVTRQEFN